jgi:hypothetical protein
MVTLRGTPILKKYKKDVDLLLTLLLLEITNNNVNLPCAGIKLEEFQLFSPILEKLSAPAS